MRIIQTALPGCVVIEPAVHGDSRGFFYESWNARTFADAGIDIAFVQTNVSRSARGVLRGLHYQWPHPQGKLVSVVEGEVYDVAVDIRVGSPTFGHWAAAILSGLGFDAAAQADRPDRRLLPVELLEPARSALGHAARSPDGTVPTWCPP